MKCGADELNLIQFDFVSVSGYVPVQISFVSGFCFRSLNWFRALVSSLSQHLLNLQMEMKIPSVLSSLLMV